MVQTVISTSRKQLLSLVGNFTSPSKPGAVQTDSLLWTKKFIFLHSMEFNKCICGSIFFYLTGLIHFAKISVAVTGGC